MHTENYISFAVMVAFIFLEVCEAQPKRFRFCGKNLNDALRVACADSGFNTPDWDSDKPVVATTTTGYRESVGVVTECCHRGCSYRTLISYCKYNKITSLSNFDEIMEQRLRSSFPGLGSGRDSKAVRMASSSEVIYDNVKRSAPFIGTVAPEYLRLPRTLDEAISSYIPTGY